MESEKYFVLTYDDRLNRPKFADGQTWNFIISIDCEIVNIRK
jgi:hypothetical protein